MKTLISSIANILVFAATQLAYSQPAQNTQLIDTIDMNYIREELVKMTDNIYVIQPYGGMCGNTGVFIGEDGVVLIDDQWEQLAGRIKKVVSTITDKEIKLIINTHHHFDHTNGNLAFSKEGIEIISHENAYQRMSESTVVFPTYFNVVQKPYPESARPTVTFYRKYTVRKPNETISLVHFSNAHTDGDIVVHFEKANIFHTGDLFMNFRLPNIDEGANGGIYGIIDAVEYVLENSDESTKIIPGHGNIATRKDIVKYHSVLRDFTTIVEASIKEGLDIDSIIELVNSKIEMKHSAGDEFISIVHRSIMKYSETR